MNDLLFRALHVASDYHWLKFRKDGKTPYIVHPIEVARFLQKDCQVEDDDIIAIAFLHDTIEDTEATKEELAKLFGEKIANVVDELTFYEDSTSKQYYLDNFHLKSDKAVIVKCADRLCNTMDFIYSRDNNDKAYAGKYLRKAEKLFGILNNFDRFPKDYFVADKLMSIYQNYLAITGV